MKALSWTEQATEDLAAIHAFISQDSPHYATVVVRQLIAAVDQRWIRTAQGSETLRRSVKVSSPGAYSSTSRAIARPHT